MTTLRRSRHTLLLFFALLTCFGYFLPRWADWNQNSRLDLVLAVVDRGTLSIDAYYQNTGDYAVVDGHYYSDKAPGTAFLGIPVYALARPLLNAPPVRSMIDRMSTGAAFATTLNEEGSGIAADKVYMALVLYLVTLAVVALPAALLGVLLYHFLRIFGLSAAWRACIVLVYGLATPAFPYSGSFFGHQLVAFLLFAAFYLTYLMRGNRRSPLWSLLVGFLLGYAAIAEYPSVLIGGAIALYGLHKHTAVRWVAGLATGALPPLALLAAYDLAIFGNVLPTGYTQSALYGDIHGQGFISLVGPHWDALWGITFSSYRGLFFIAPVTLLALPGFVVWFRQPHTRPEAVVCAWAVFSFLLFNGSSVMWQGGFSIGPRYILPMLPFMFVAVGAFAAVFGARIWGRSLVALLGVWSFLVVWAQTIGGQAFPDWTPNPLVNYSLPALIDGNIARNVGMVFGLTGWASLVPLLTAVALLAVAGTGRSVRRPAPASTVHPRKLGDEAPRV